MSDRWNTPKYITQALGYFDLDPCASATSHVQCGQRFGLDLGIDGLDEEWKSTDKTAPAWSVFVNPPYSKPLPWCQKLRDHNGPWCALVKLDPTTKSWSALMEANPTVAPFRKRIKFEGDKDMTANFPSVLVWSAWRPPAELVPHLWLSSYAQTRAA
jgi:hypothetical protein